MTITDTTKIADAVTSAARIPATPEGVTRWVKCRPLGNPIPAVPLADVTDADSPGIVVLPIAGEIIADTSGPQIIISIDPPTLHGPITLHTIPLHGPDTAHTTERAYVGDRIAELDVRAHPTDTAHYPAALARTLAHLQLKAGAATLRIDRLVEAAHEAADSHSWCSEFDDIMESVGLPRRTKTYLFDITVHTTASVPATSEEEARELLERDADDVFTDSLTSYHDVTISFDTIED